MLFQIRWELESASNMHACTFDFVRIYAFRGSHEENHALDEDSPSGIATLSAELKVIQNYENESIMIQ